jgi:5'-3' exonuclease
MGIQSYTKRLLKNYNDLSIKKLMNIDNLFIDFNGLIHPCSHEVLATNLVGKSKSSVRKLIIKNCCNALDNAVKFSNPQKLIYIAIDGVAPVSKMLQQRLRRYLTISSDKQYFDKCEITPGTEFMQDLSKELKQYCKKHYKIKVIISDSSVPGEGEHKILEYLRENNNSVAEQVSVINGLDADLIMLTLATQLENLYLMRNEVEIDLVKIYGNTHYLSIGKLRDAFRQDIAKYLKIPGDTNNIINDYILICFFGGNDFLHHLPSIDIKYNGLDTLLEIYWEYLNNSGNNYLTNGSSINFKSFTNFISILVNREPDMIKHIGNCMDNSRTKTRFVSEEAKKKYMDELITPVYDPVKFSQRGWQYRYYQHLFHMDQIDSIDIKKICHDYIKTMEWNLEYYLSGCKNWNTCYQFLHAPTITDIRNHLIDYKIQESQVVHPVSPFEQLALVLPLQSAINILPRNITTILETDLIHFYPMQCGIDYTFCNQRWQAKPVYPQLDIKEITTSIQKELKNCTLKERNRNKIGKVIIIN